MRGIRRAGVLAVVLGAAVSWAQGGRQPPRQQPQGAQPRGERAEVLVPQEWKRCMEALAEPEPVARMTGTVQQVAEDILVIEDAYGRRIDLRGGRSACLLWGGAPLDLAELQEGTAVRVSYYVDEETGVTARVVRVIEQQRPAP